MVAIFLLLFFSCSKNVNLQETDKKYHISHSYKPNDVLLLSKGDELFCVAYFQNTDKRLEITNLNTQDKKTIKLPEYLSGQYLLSVNPDTVYIYENLFVGELHLITSKGYEKTIDLLSLINQNRVKLYGSSQIYNNALYVSGYNLTHTKIDDNLIEYEYKILTEMVLNERVFVFKNLFTDSICVNQILSNFVKSEIVKSDRFTSTNGLKIKNFKNATICFHENSDLLFVFNNVSGKIENRIQIISDYSSLKAPLVQLYDSESGKEEFVKQRQEAPYLNGVIYDVIFDEYRDLYFVVALLPNKDFHYLNNLTFERDWSLIVLNKIFNKAGEFFFDKNKFDFRTVFPIKEGILIANKNLNNEKTEFVLFQVL